MDQDDHKQRANPQIKSAFTLSIISLVTWFVGAIVTMVPGSLSFRGTVLGLVILSTGVMGIIGFIFCVRGFSSPKNWKYWVSICLHSVAIVLLTAIVFANVLDIGRSF